MAVSEKTDGRIHAIPEHSAAVLNGDAVCYYGGVVIYENGKKVTA